MSWLPLECYGWRLWAIEEWQKTDWARFGMRFKISDEFMDIGQAREYVYLKFWRSRYAGQLVFGPLDVRELPYEDWEKEYERLGIKRFQIMHYGRKERTKE